MSENNLQEANDNTYISYYDETHTKLLMFAFIVVMCLFTYRGFIMYEDVFLKSAKYAAYPTLMDSSEETSYHSTRHIQDQMYFMNGLNEFYVSYTLNTNYVNEAQKERYIMNEDQARYYDNQYKTLVFGPSFDKNNVLRVGIVCGQHARELISPEFCYQLIRLIQLQSRHPDLTTRIAKLIGNGVSFWIMPVVNEWGRNIVLEDPSQACLRKNAAGVDLNRNFNCPDFFRGDAQNDPSSIEYPGEQDLSEPESAVTDAFLHLSQPHMLFNIHSGAEKILLPYDCCEKEIPKQYTLMARVANLARKEVAVRNKNYTLVKPRKWQVGKSSLLLYSSHGTLMDYASAILKIPLAYTFEIYESNNSDDTVSDADLTPQQCKEWFNPSEGEEYRQVLIVWLDQLITMVEKTYHRLKLT